MTVQVCPICDIAGCIHIRSGAKASPVVMEGNGRLAPLSPANVERVARRFCELMGLDADERLGSRLDYEASDTVPVFRWETAKEAAREAIAMQLAMNDMPGVLTHG